MPDEQNVKIIMNGFVNACEDIDECYLQAFAIVADDERELFEADVSGCITRDLLNGNFINNVNEFEKKIGFELGIQAPWGNCETPDEIKLLKKCCYDLRVLTQDLST